MFLQGASRDDFASLALIGFGYALYILVFASLTVAVSALFASARTALVVLLGFWAVSTLLVPRVAPSLAESLKPTPSAPAFRAAVTEEAKNGVSGHDPADARLDAIKQALLKQYGATDVDALPVNFRGLALEFGEKNSTETYNRHFEKLYEVYKQQALLQRGFAGLSPTLALQPWSRAFASTDFANHLSFLREVEDYRYRLVQTLNREVAAHKPAPGESNHRADIANLTRNIEFSPQKRQLIEVATEQAPNLVILLVWVFCSTAFAAACTSRLGGRL